MTKVSENVGNKPEQEETIGLESTGVELVFEDLPRVKPFSSQELLTLIFDQKDLELRKKGLRYLEKACDEGDLIALVYMGGFYKYGKMVKKDSEKGRRFLELAYSRINELNDYPELQKVLKASLASSTSEPSLSPR